jgi:hypothetical protein
MCPCKSCASFFADPAYRCPELLAPLVAASADRHPEQFSTEMLELTEEDFQAGNKGYYLCSQCLQWWYMEFASEEVQWPIFGVKSSEEQRREVVLLGRKDQVVESARAQVLELLLGQSESSCATVGCKRHALNRVALCSAHYYFPW